MHSYQMYHFDETYKDNGFVSSLLTQIGWTNRLLIQPKMTDK